MCESGGNYGAVNPSSGAGGAYQILPSTWELYGGQGEPAGRPEGRTGPDRRRNLGRLGPQRLGLRLEPRSCRFLACHPGCPRRPLFNIWRARRRT